MDLHDPEAGCGRDFEKAIPRMAKMLKERRIYRRASQRQLADAAGLDPAVVSRVERGHDARLRTWARLFEALGYRLLFDYTELCEEADDLIMEESDRRKERQLDALWQGGRRR